MEGRVEGLGDLRDPLVGTVHSSTIVIDSSHDASDLTGQLPRLDAPQHPFVKLIEAFQRFASAFLLKLLACWHL